MSTIQGMITLLGEERNDGSVYVHSPDVPLFHVVAPHAGDWVDWVEPILKEHLERNLGGAVGLTRAPSWEETLERELPVHIPAAHMIAERAHT